MNELVDTHCHIHSETYKLNPEQVIAQAKTTGVTRLICVGTDLMDSQRSVEFAAKHDNCWATIGLHPHEASRYLNDSNSLDQFKSLVNASKVVAIGESGLDYYYHHSSSNDQQKLLRFQIELALASKLPMVFHVRDAFADFWKIFDQYKDIKGVIHSFSADIADLDMALERGLYISLNGIMTFTKNKDQLEAAKAVPLNRLLLETDAPFLTPVPERGKICEPKHVRLVANFLANLRDESPDILAEKTTLNAVNFFVLS